MTADDVDMEFCSRCCGLYALPDLIAIGRHSGATVWLCEGCAGFVAVPHSPEDE